MIIRHIRMLDAMERKGPGIKDAVLEIATPCEGTQELFIEDEPYAALILKFGISRGLGDTVAKITKAIGLKPCGGCKKRQDKLNKNFPYS